MDSLTDEERAAVERAIAGDVSTDQEYAGQLADDPATGEDEQDDAEQGDLTGDHPENRAEDGYPLGLPRAIEELSRHEIQAVANRHNLWTARRMRLFLQALAQTCSVKQAAAAVGMSRQSAYRLRARLSGQPFDDAWDAALEFGLQQLAHAALDRALNGVEEPVFHNGEQVGTRTRYDERLTMFLLAHPARIGRHPVGREADLNQWDRLLNGIEHGPPTWAEYKEIVVSDEDEAEAKRQGEASAQEFLDRHSHYRAVERREAAARDRSRAPASPRVPGR